MNKILFSILTTLIGFAVGILAGVWMTRTPPIPAPPAGILDEVRDAPLGSTTAATSADTADNQAAYQKIRAEMDDFRKKVDAIKSTLRDEMDPLLTSEQRALVKTWPERPPAVPTPAPAATATAAQTLPAAPKARNFYEGFDATITIIMVPYSLERLDSRLHFTPEQKTAVRQLLLERRAKFLDLVDTTPPPSFKLIKLAPPEAQTPSK